MRLFQINIKRMGTHRNRVRHVEAPSFDKLEGPVREALIPFHPAIEHAPITISDTPTEDGSRAGQVDYGLIGEFTVQQLD